MALLAVLAVAVPLVVSAGEANPLGKVIELLDSLAAKVEKDGEVEAKAFTEYTAWCDDAAQNAKFAIEDAKKEKATLEAKIAELGSDVEVADAKIEKLAAAVASAESDLKDATVVRKKEAADFSQSEKELVETLDTLSRAVSVLEREMSKNPAALAQVDGSSAAGAMQALAAVLDAAALPSSDRRRLQALIQQQTGDDEMAAPAAAAYKTHSGGIFEALEDLKEKAEAQLSELRAAETSSSHNFELLRSSLEAQKGQDAKDLKQETANKAEAEEGKATAEGELARVSKSLGTSNEELASTQAACLSTAADHDATVAGRKEELKVIADAKRILEETSSGAVSQSYSLVQVAATMRTRVDLMRSEVVTLVRSLAKRHHSAALTQLASKIAAIQRFGASSGEDPFAKVKGLLQDMIEKLESELQAEATEKAYCDEELAKTEARKGELEDDVEKATAKIDSSVARSAQLKEAVATLQAELSALTKEQAEMDKLRQETHADYEVAKADLELGLGGVRKALTVLREYYGASAAALIQDDQLGAFMQQPAPPVKHSKASGAGSSIIGILEVVESDFAKNLAQEEAQEADAQSKYEKVTQENKITKESKSQDEKYKSQEAKALDKTASEYSADLASANTELSAVMEYYGKLKSRCIAKPETYEARAARRQAEIAGLKSAIKTLDEETALMQRSRRGGRRRAHGFLGAH